MTTTMLIVTNGIVLIRKYMRLKKGRKLRNGLRTGPISTIIAAIFPDLIIYLK
jgi:hypothetical protein